MARDREDLDPYQLLADMAAAELELVRNGSFETVALLQEERRTLVSRLPSQAPPSALEPLERAAELQRETSVAIESALALARSELARLDAGRTAVQAYAPSITHNASVDYAG